MSVNATEIHSFYYYYYYYFEWLLMDLFGLQYIELGYTWAYIFCEMPSPILDSIFQLKAQENEALELSHDCQASSRKFKIRDANESN